MKTIKSVMNRDLKLIESHEAIAKGVTNFAIELGRQVVRNNLARRYIRRFQNGMYAQCGKCGQLVPKLELRRYSDETRLCEDCYE